MNAILIFLVTFSIIHQARAVPGELKSILEREVQKSRLKTSELGIVVSYFSGGEVRPIYSLNDDSLMIPASASKVITAAAALDLLGPGWKFVTQLVSSGPVEADLLKGDLYLKGGGDPGFVSESMWFLVNEFHRTGIRTIQGDVIVDDSRFDRVRADESREDSRVDRAYDAPVGAMSFNWNSVNVFVRPGLSGQDARVFIDPENQFVHLKGNIKTEKKGSKNSVSVHRVSGEGGDEIRISGSIPENSKERVYYKNVSDPNVWSGQNLISFLDRRGIKVKGKVRTGKSPKGARVLAKAESKPVAHLVMDMMKFSNNFVAEMLTKNIAAEKLGMPASLSQGMKLIRDFMVSSGVPNQRFQFVNPSGLTRENKIRPKDLHDFMVAMERKFSIFPEDLAAYSLAGIDGTLKSRMTASPATGRVRAKTGRMTGIAALAGYAGRDDGALLTFVFMYNGRAAYGEDAHALFDRLSVRLVE